MTKYLFFLLFLLLSVESKSQIDKEFWFVAPEATSSHGDRPIFMRISTMEEPASITLSMPASRTFNPISQLIPPNTTFSIDLTTWIDSIENKPADRILNSGLHLVSDKYVTAYYEIAHTNNPGIFPLKGKNGLGTEFYIVGQNNYSNQSYSPPNPPATEAFDIVATEDSTWITVTPSIAIIGHPAGIPFLIFLNKGQTYSCQTTNTAASVTLAGSYVTSTKPVAITISDDSIITGGWDIIGDQIIPVNLLGKEYIVVKGYADNSASDNDERIYVVATQDNTEVFLDGSASPFTTLNKGNLMSYPIPTASSTVYIESSYPVYVYHLTGNSGEAGASLIPHDSCTGSQQIGFNRTGSGFFAMVILTRSGNEDAFTLNGGTTVITAADFSPVTGTGGAWVYARKSMTVGQVPLGANLLQNSEGKFHLGIINDLGGSSEYGYYSAYSSLYLGADRSMCLGDSIMMDAGPYMNSYEWYKKNGAVYSLVGNSRYYTVNDSGYYAAVVNDFNCSLSDTIHVSYYNSPSVSIGNDTTICQGNTLVLDPGDFNSYLWQNGGTGRYFYATTSGTYWVKTTNNNNCAASDTMNLSVEPYPSPNGPITGPVTVCQGQNNVLFYTNEFSGAESYQWTFPSGYTGASTNDSVYLNFSTLAVSDTIRVRGVNNCGTSTNEVKFGVTVNPLPQSAKPITGTPSVCQGATGIAYSLEAILNATNYLWTLPTGVTISAGNNTNSIVTDFSLSASSGTITVTGQNSCGTGASASFPVAVTLFPSPAGSITGPLTVCQGESFAVYSVPPFTGADTIIWSLPGGATITSGLGTASVTVKFDSATASTGNIGVHGTSFLCGDGIPSITGITVNPLPDPAGIITGPDTVCQAQTNVIFTVPSIPDAQEYDWTIPSGASIVSGISTSSIQVSFSTSAASGNITVRGHNPLCGYGLPSVFPLTVKPLPGPAGLISGVNPVCQETNSNLYTISPVLYASSYIWQTTGSGWSSSTLMNNLTVDFSGTANSGIISVTGHNSCGDGPVSANYNVTVNPVPLTTLNICNTLTTHDAKPFILKGGIPLGGSYSGTGVTGSVFNPASVPIMKDTVIVNYHYTNTYGCHKNATQMINLARVSFVCGSRLTDIRDNRTYGTILIGSQCWLTENLNFGTRIRSGEYASDNCVSEKYCYDDIPSNCDANGGLYQWKEMMSYDDTPGSQGICPPTWHIPNNNEWTILFSSFINNGFAGSPLKSTGFSGFDALMTGERFMNSSWSMDNFSTFMWSCTMRDESKAWAHGFNIYNPSVSAYPGTISNAFSVRCLKD